QETKSEIRMSKSETNPNQEKGEIRQRACVRCDQSGTTQVHARLSWLSLISAFRPFSLASDFEIRISDFCPLRVPALLCLALLLLPACSNNQPTTQPTSWNEQARNDPFNYNPKMDNADISGGGLGELHKDSMKRDLDHVL